MLTFFLPNAIRNKIFSSPASAGDFYALLFRHCAPAALRAYSIHWRDTPNISPVSHFNPRTRVGCDFSRSLTRSRKRNFNPRTRVGCDSKIPQKEVRYGNFTLIVYTGYKFFQDKKFRSEYGFPRSKRCEPTGEGMRTNGSHRKISPHKSWIITPPDEGPLAKFRRNSKAFHPSVSHLSSSGFQKPFSRYTACCRNPPV